MLEWFKNLFRKEEEEIDDWWNDDDMDYCSYTYGPVDEKEDISPEEEKFLDDSDDQVEY
jgi:hypothetical protein